MLEYWSCLSTYIPWTIRAKQIWSIFIAIYNIHETLAISFYSENSIDWHKIKPQYINNTELGKQIWSMQKLNTFKLMTFKHDLNWFIQYCMFWCRKDQIHNQHSRHYTSMLQTQKCHLTPFVYLHSHYFYNAIVSENYKKLSNL